ncbi:hypothetical protein CXF72_08165 [Psychromonas sp. MB-3u-54]|uniref:NRDE family protein n=1 Tax=Psychromonas sp. MB-3u-54 TaxID=2058319 RepID=UPI000C33D3EB|nr:NRDE family protein [Psychromonas sp. MB-3u-54]PKH03053.1 hypothetical protein CXF72_08165 [Psychromonas sp. MB-3u-54]
MCTLSVLRLSNSLVITMNRDEARLRHEAGLKQQQKNGVERLYPIDGQAGGTWFGVNNHGVVLALLNRYQDPQSSTAPTRGNIIPQALAYGNVKLVKKHLSEQSYQYYNPFDLVLMSGRECLHLSWNGRHLSTHNVCQAALLLSSSALNTEAVLAKRQRHFQQWLAQLPELSAAEVLQKIHLQHNPDSQGDSVLMDRSDAHSKSICQVLLDANYCEFNYYSEASLQQWRSHISDGKHPQLKKQQRLLTLQSPTLSNELPAL